MRRNKPKFGDEKKEERKRRQQETKKPHVTYYTNGDGKWEKVIWASQCIEDVFMAGRCQGFHGHKGYHWCYSENGSYCWEVNKADPKPQDKNIACGQTPAGHKSYKSPVDMQKHYYMSHRVHEKVTDAKLIARLERGDLKDGESVNRPVTAENTDKKTLKMLERRIKKAGLKAKVK